MAHINRVKAIFQAAKYFVTGLLSDTTSQDNHDFLGYFKKTHK